MGSCVRQPRKSAPRSHAPVSIDSPDQNSPNPITARSNRRMPATLLTPCTGRGGKREREKSCLFALLLFDLSPNSISLSSLVYSTRTALRSGGFLNPNMNELSSTDSDSDYCKYWVEWFTCSEGNEYFCDVDEDYILDRFNLTNLPFEVPHYQKALELITDRLPDKPMSDKLREQVELSAKHLYGLIHARYIITARGLVKMLDKYKRGDFGRCPRVYCYQNSLLPVGVTDVPNQKAVKLYCSRCEDVYNPKSRKHNMIDGAYFGTSFPHMLFQVYPSLKPAPSEQRYVPRIFGFKIHSIAELHRWQDEQREEQKKRLGIEMKK